MTLKYMLFSAIAFNVSSKTYNLFYSDYQYSIFGGPACIWGLSIDTSNTANCCSGDLLISTTTQDVIIAGYTVLNGSITAWIGEEGETFQSTLIATTTNTQYSIYRAPTKVYNNLGDFYVIADVSNLKSNCSNATGVWLNYGDRKPFNYGCVDLLTAEPTTVYDFDDEQDVTETGKYAGGIYDPKRDLLWIAFSPFDDTKLMTFSIHSDGSNMTQSVYPMINGTEIIWECHYSAYYDIYPCLFGQVWGYFDPKNQAFGYLGSTFESTSIILSVALLDNGKTVVLVDSDLKVFMMDVMKADFHQIGVLKLPDYSPDEGNSVEGHFMAFGG